MTPGDDPIVDTVRELLNTGCRVLGAAGGGSLSSIWRIRLDDGADGILKRTPAARVEASMLAALGAAGAPVPAVLGVADETLVLEALAHEGGPASAWSDLGDVIARVHGSRGELYGWHDDYAFGAVAIVNTPGDDWPRFWGEHRLAGPAAARVAAGSDGLGAGRGGAALPETLRRRIEVLAADLPSRLPRKPFPALLHGDLWGGNVLAAGGRVTGLIDPACYHGDAEVDLAMLDLFDSPPAAFFERYGPLEAGWRARRPIYQLWPAIVHARLFGSGYFGLVDRLLGQAGT